tara:strand:+ start:43779 stop:44228 length:450 start_codon:yes stop_codon:yes gene_type:complete
MKSLFNEEAYAEITSRLDTLSPQSQAQWGKMDVAQMLAHCREPLKVPLGKITLAPPNPVMKFLFSFFKKSLYDDKPWKHGLPTSKEFKITDPCDFQKEKEGLKALINEFYAERTRTQWPPHPFCGHFTTEQWGKMQYKHLDHHFRQFGA